VNRRQYQGGQLQDEAIVKTPLPQQEPATAFPASDLSKNTIAEVKAEKGG
jgi:hypothetical protein